MLNPQLIFSSSGIELAGKSFCNELGQNFSVPGAQKSYACIALLQGLHFVCTFVQHGCVDQLGKAAHCTSLSSRH